ncbi:hypothetical protein EDD71_1268 [Fonticella tunisiensis]|uniref:DUF2802 domain-containing protein n=2 Tax=Fonticella tunisiensis TaxID=1096341 RepID=A0A4V3ERY9_9CLOT|nr:hypothetical protein EDD71_1268 [Fonticella tunisiensis]
MPYVILIVGLILIYISLKNNSNHQEREMNFHNILNKEINKDEISELKKTISELTIRVEEIEKAILLLGDREIKDTSDVEIKESKNVKRSLTASHNDKNSQIYKLYDEGKSIEEICSILNMGKGEVLLRIGLRKQKEL